MKVFVVMKDREDWDEVLGVYASRESADNAIRVHRYQAGVGAPGPESYTVIPETLEN